MRLSQNFTLAEMVGSQVATRRGIDNRAPMWAIERLADLATEILQPVRNRFGPVTVTSGWRCQDLERALKGRPEGWRSASQHARGEAADFEVRGRSNLEVARWIEAALPFDQLILEFYEPPDPNSGWIHCSYVRPPRGVAMQALRQGSDVAYIRGLPQEPS